MTMWSPTQVIQVLGAATSLLVAATPLVKTLSKFTTSLISEMRELVIEKTPAF
jgi:hypothetical protein